MPFQIRGSALGLLVLGLSGPAWCAAGITYQLTTLAGSDLVGDNGSAVTAQVAQPEGLAIDRDGNLYIADAANHRIRKVTPGGAISTVAGNGHPGFAGDGGPAQSAQLNQPYGVAVDISGNLYIADYGNQRVRRVTGDGTIDTIAGTGDRGFHGDGKPAASAPLLGPRNVAVDSSGTLYVSEFDGHRVRSITPDGIIHTAAGNGIAGFGGDGNLAVDAQLASPAGLAVDSAGALYIVDSVNVRIRKVSSGLITTVCDRRTFAMPSIRLSGIAVGPAGQIYIPESVNSFVWQLAPDGTLTRFAGTPGNGAYSGDGQPALLTALVTPVDVAVDVSGGVCISELRRVRCSPPDGSVLATRAGDGTFGFGGEGVAAKAAVLNAPLGIALFGGDVYIADQGNQRIRKIASDGIISTVAGVGDSSFAGDGLAAIAASLSGPNSVAFDSSGNLYIADGKNNRVRRVDVTGTITTFAGSGIPEGFGGEGDPAILTPLAQPQAVAFDASGNLYIADAGHDRVLRVDSGASAHTVAGTGSPGYTGDSDTSPLPQLHGPSGLALDSSGNLYIADTLNHRVRLVTPDGLITTVAGTGESGFTGDGSAATAAQLSSPRAVAVDSKGNLYIADTANHRIRLVTPDGKIQSIAGTGEGTYNGDQGPARETGLNNPSGIAVDSQGNVFVSDTGNSRIRVLAPGQAENPPPSARISITSAASFLPGAIAPGEIISIFGDAIGPATPVSSQFDGAGRLPTILGDTQVFFDTTPAPLFYAGSNQINAQVPYEVAGKISVQVQILYQGNPLAVLPVSIVESSPAFFTIPGGHSVVAVNEDWTLNSSSNPAVRGSIVVLYATGEGQTNPVGATGQAIAASLPRPLLPVVVTIGGLPAPVLYAGGAPGFVGLLQVNVRVPSGFVPAGNLPVTLAVGPYQAAATSFLAVN
ncbi:MAG: hypothetical protein U0Q18_34265 [Bryobacteraceae bacterium]